jgi:hypothetical protein
MISLPPPPDWAPSLLQPQDWLVVKILAILVLITFLAGVATYKRGYHG